ncbi:CYCD3-1, partial [Linum perenne]
FPLLPHRHSHYRQLCKTFFIFFIFSKSPFQSRKQKHQRHRDPDFHNNGEPITTSAHNPTQPQMSLLPTPLRRLSPEHSPEPSPEHSPELSDSDDLTSVSYLYCDEDRFEETDEGEVLDPLDRLSFHDDDDDDEELCSLFVKERSVELKKVARSPAARRRAVEWIVKVNSHYGFSTLTAVLAINYLDRFIAGPCYEKPWTIQLVAVGCLSLAAKVEETYVPLLLDLQVLRRLGTCLKRRRSREQSF